MLQPTDTERLSHKEGSKDGASSSLKRGNRISFLGELDAGGIWNRRDIIGMGE